MTIKIEFEDIKVACRLEQQTFKQKIFIVVLVLTTNVYPQNVFIHTLV